MTIEEARNEIMAVNETVIEATIALEVARTLLHELIQRTGDVVVSAEEEPRKRDLIEQTRGIAASIEDMCQ